MGSCYKIVDGPSRDTLFKNMKLSKPVTFKCTSKRGEENIIVSIWEITLGARSGSGITHGHSWFVKGTTLHLKGWPPNRGFQLTISFESDSKTGDIVAELYSN
jgi:hypothetical protein